MQLTNPNLAIPTVYVIFNDRDRKAKAECLTVYNAAPAELKQLLTEAIAARAKKQNRGQIPEPSSA